MTQSPDDNVLCKRCGAQYHMRMHGCPGCGALNTSLRGSVERFPGGARGLAIFIAVVVVIAAISLWAGHAARPEDRGIFGAVQDDSSFNAACPYSGTWRVCDVKPGDVIAFNRGGFGCHDLGDLDIAITAALAHDEQHADDATLEFSGSLFKQMFADSACDRIHRGVRGTVLNHRGMRLLVQMSGAVDAWVPISAIDRLSTADSTLVAERLTAP